MSCNDFERGYFCAVAVFLKESGCVTTYVKTLFKNGGDWRKADQEDIELFFKHGLLRGGRLGA